MTGGPSPSARVLSALPLPWPFEREYLQLALVAALAVGASVPLIGAFLVQRRLSLLGDGLGHLAFAGVGIGVLAGRAPLWTALVVAVAGALVVERIRRRSRSSGDLALSLIFYGGIAVGNVLLSRAPRGANAQSWLFGALLTVTRTETAVLFATAVVIAGVVAVAGRALFAVVLDEEGARVAGLPVAFLNDTVMVLAAVAVVVGMRTVGILLVSALMVLPVGAASAVTTSFRGLLLGSALLGAVSAVTGLVAARVFDLAAGGAIVLVAAASFVVATGLGSRRRPR
jgi:zinc transport system permease protein